MKKLIKPAIFIFIGLLIGFYLGMRTTHKYAFVYVTILNESKKNINTLTITSEYSVQTIKNIPTNESRHLKFYAGGETSYSLQVIFLDGTQLNSDGRYAEGGYKITETISENGISPNFNSGLF